MSERVDACAYDAEVRKAERVVLFVLGLLIGGVLMWATILGTWLW